MYVIDGTNIKLTRGDSFYCEISMKNSSGETYEPQAGDVVRFYLKRDLLNPPKSEYIDRNPLISKAVPTDTMILHLEPDDTKGLGFGEYVYDVELTFANGDVDTFINNARFSLVPEVS